jgi:hypothetical protein
MMKMIGVIAALALGGGLAWTLLSDDGALNSQDPVALTGCLRSGSASTVYVLRGAELPTSLQPDNQMRRDYLLVDVADGINLDAVLNHRVTITGIVSDAGEGPTPPQEANAAERALRRLTVQRMQDVAPNCSAPEAMQDERR